MEMEQMLDVFNIERFALHDGPGIRTNIFLQGCPLRCAWCANPESQCVGRKLMHLDSKCVGCGACVRVCPQKAVYVKDGKAVIDREKCNNCGRCVDDCMVDANKISGKKISLNELYECAMRDRDYYARTNGGITFSGGEALIYAQKLLPLISKLHKEGISIAFETCGNVGWSCFETVIPYADYFLIDIKSMDGAQLYKYTGGDLRLILGNLEKLAEKCLDKIIVRIPVIPSVNYNYDSIGKIYKYINSLGISKVDLLPFHTLGITKYNQLGREYNFDELVSLKENDLEALKEYGETLGLSVSIGGKRDE